MECNLFESEYPRCCCSVAQLCLILRDPIDCSTPGFPVLHHLPELAQYVYWVSDAIQPSHPLSSPSPAFYLSSIRVLSNESVLRIKWPKYWSFNFSIIPTSEYSGLISFRIDPGSGSKSELNALFMLLALFCWFNNGSNLHDHTAECLGMTTEVDFHLVILPKALAWTKDKNIGRIF